jgi:hypothetical protein
VAHGPNAFRELLAAAADPQPPEKGLTPNEAADDPHRLARPLRPLLKYFFFSPLFFLTFGKSEL